MFVPLTLMLGSVLVGLGVLLSRRRRFVDTTLVAPYRWTVVSLSVLAVIETWLALASASQPMVLAMRYFAATSTLCPLMAVLGAKRPQNVGWQWIVASLWVVLVLPVCETILLWRGGALDEGPARRWLLLILLGVGLSNYVLTRFWLAAVLGTIGQAMLLLRQLPIPAIQWNFHFEAGIVVLTVALAIAWAQTRSASGDAGWNRVWRDFRDAFGLVWALRVMERVNATAKQSDWESELTWFGFTEVGEQSTREHDELERTMRTTLRRFVSPAWIDARR